MKLRHASAPLAIVCLSIAFLSGCGKKESADETQAAVATVNGKPITQKEFDDYLITKSSVMVSGQQGPQVVNTYGPVGLQALRDMVDHELILEVAKDEGVLPTDADVQKELDFQNQLTPGYTDTFTQKEGLSLDEVKAQLLVDLARFRVVTKGVTVTMNEVDQYVKENPKQFTQPAHDSLLIIEVQKPDKKALVDKALASGKPFGEVAAQLSDDPHAKSTAGKMGDLPVAQLPKLMQDALAKTPALHTTSWITLGPANVKFFVESKTPDKVTPLTTIQKQALQRDLMLQRGQATNDLNSKILAKLRTASVDVTVPVLKGPWTQLETQLKRAPAAPAPGGAGPGGPGPGGPAAGGPPPGGPTPAAPKGGPSPSVHF